MPTHYIGLIEPLLEHGVPLKATVERKLLLPEHRGRWVVRIDPDRGSSLEAIEAENTFTSLGTFDF